MYIAIVNSNHRISLTNRISEFTDFTKQVIEDYANIARFVQYYDASQLANHRHLSLFMFALALTPLAGMLI